jgi:MoaA/NifB/PqqE/SkfB family radical SAM enzyme
MWCPLPWTHLGIKNNGDLRMCSHSQSAGSGPTLLVKDGKTLTVNDLHDQDVLNCDTLKQVRLDMLQGRWPEQCRRCESESNIGANSRDKWETDRHRESFTKSMAIELTAADGTVTDCNFQDFDLRIGNQCNLRCVMCFPGEASKWYDAHAEITGLDHFVVDDTQYDLINSTNAFSWSKYKQNIESLIKNSSQLLKIKFGGGEPLLIKHHRYLLESLIAAGHSGRMELEYSSNVTVFPPDLFVLWQNFKKIRICASVDAVNTANEAIRYHTKWQTVVDNLRMLDDSEDNISVFISSTISTISLEHYGELLSWIEDQRFKKIKDNVSHLVYNPKYFNIAILEPHQMDRILRKVRSDILPYPRLSKKIDHYENLYNTIALDEVNAELSRQWFVQIWDKFQLNQQQDWNNIFPIASTVVEDWKNRYKI